MKKNLKTAIALFLCVFLFFSATACKQNPAQNSSDSTSKEPVTIKWLAYQTLAQPDPNSAICLAVEKKFNIKFDFMYVDNANWDDQLNVKLAGGDIPDVMFLRDQTHIAKYVQQGILAELPWATVQKKAPNYIKMLGKYDTNKIIPQYCTLGGKNYGFATINVNATYPSPIIWRTDWLNNVGISKIPSTLTEFEDAMTKFRNNDPDKDGKKDTYGFSNSMMADIYASYGITDAGACLLTTQNGKIVFSSTTAEAKQVLTKFAAWYKDGIIDPQYITGEHTTGYWAISNAFENNTIGVTGLANFYHYSAPLSDGDLGGPVYQDIKKVNPNMQFAPGKAIVGPTGKSGATININGDAPVGITVQGAKNPRIVDATLAMLNAMYSDDKDYIVLNTYGTKDVDYTINAQGVYVNKITVAADGRKKGLLVFTYGTINPDMVKAFSPPLYEWGDANFKYAAISAPITAPTTEYSSANAQYFQNLQKLTTQVYTNIITGKADISTFDAYVKQFNDNGGTAIETAANAANKAK